MTYTVSITSQGQISIPADIRRALNLGKNKKAVEDYKGGKEESLQFLVGQVMAATKGRAKPDIARDTLKKLLK